MPGDIKGNLAEGESLRQDRIASIFNTSRIPCATRGRGFNIRVGLITNQQYSGAVVCGLSIEEMAEIVESRALERHLARPDRPISPAQLTLINGMAHAPCEHKAILCAASRAMPKKSSIAHAGPCARRRANPGRFSGCSRSVAGYGSFEVVQRETVGDGDEGSNPEKDSAFISQSVSLTLELHSSGER